MSLPIQATIIAIIGCMTFCEAMKDWIEDKINTFERGGTHEVIRTEI